MNEYSYLDLSLLLLTLKHVESLEKRTEVLSIMENNTHLYFPGMYEQLVEYINRCEFENIPELFGDEHAESIARYIEDITEDEIISQMS